MFGRKAGDPRAENRGGNEQDANVQLQKQLEALGLGQLQIGQLGKSSSSKII